MPSCCLPNFSSRRGQASLSVTMFVHTLLFFFTFQTTHIWREPYIHVHFTLVHCTQCCNRKFLWQKMMPLAALACLFLFFSTQDSSRTQQKRQEKSPLSRCSENVHLPVSKHHGKINTRPLVKKAVFPKPLVTNT